VPSPVPAHPPLRVAVLGCGVVGTEVVRLLTTQATDLASRVGAPLELVGVAVRDVESERDPVVDRALLTADAESLVERADVVVEVMGGIEPARSLLLRAIAGGASVVTANKALLAQDGPTLYAAADEAGVDVYFEAAVAGAIPIVRPVRESLAGDRVTRVLGIVNGTTNYVLDKMASEGLDLDQAVKQALTPSRRHRRRPPTTRQMPGREMGSHHKRSTRGRSSAGTRRCVARSTTGRPQAWPGWCCWP